MSVNLTVAINVENIIIIVAISLSILAPKINC